MELGQREMDIYEKMSKDLGLVGTDIYEQDWGICNADGSRIIEFCEYIIKNNVTIYSFIPNHKEKTT